MTDHVDYRTSLALGRDAVTVTDVGALFSDEGVPIDLGTSDQHVVTVVSAPCCSHGTGLAVPTHSAPRTVQFDTSEHMIIVAGLNLRLDSGAAPAGSTGLPLGPNYSLTYGQIIALGGDFYGDPDRPVCLSRDPVGQFGLNFASLANSKDEVKRILAVAKKFEFDPIARAVAARQQPSSVYAGMGTSPGHVVPDEDRAFDEATGGTMIKNGRYLNLAATNFDHFGVDAIACYTAGHLSAQRLAVKARNQPDPASRTRSLLNAYAVNAFADHFLTDLFAAGHMRTPRRPLYDSAETGATQLAAGLCAKRMHDEDNKFGLWVTNAVGDRWVAYGDARYRDTWNAAGRVVMRAAVQQSMDDLWASYSTGQVTDQDASGVLRYTATVIRGITSRDTGKAHRDDRNNWAPLFWRDPSDGTIYRRNQLFDPSDRGYCSQGLWPSQWGLTTTTALIVAQPGVYMPRSSYGQFPPVETGMTGQYGWPPVPGSMTGPVGATGPTLRGNHNWTWSIDGSPGPSGLPV